VALLPSDVPQVAVERGGSVTLHNPGQLVGYPVVQLPTGQRNVVQFVRRLEAQLIEALTLLDISVQTRPGLTGLWVQADDWQKVGAIGLAVKQWVTYHGFALNVTNDLGPYQVIAPCGLTANSAGRLADLVPGGVTLPQVQQVITQQLSQTTLQG
jgi:lipoyl(octanoyl) transferase